MATTWNQCDDRIGAGLRSWAVGHAGAADRAALELRSGGAFVRGTGAAVVLDGREAHFAIGDNGVLGARYVMLDSFVAGDRVKP